MKFYFLFFILLLSLLNASELERVDSILKDITQLRKDYNKAQSNLVEMEVKLEEEKEKSHNYLLKVKNYKNKITSLENKIKSLKKSLKTKDNNKKIYKKQEIKIIKNIIKIEKHLSSQGNLNSNNFPKLRLKKQYKNSIIDTKAYTYRVKNEGNIYNSVDGVKIDKWEASTSFTSNFKEENWIKITGFFIDKIWHPTTKEMWIRTVDTLKREK